jgi:hypothetical protein
VQADVYLAQRSGAEAWLIKPLDALRLKRAAACRRQEFPPAAGETFHEGVPVNVPQRPRKNPRTPDRLIRRYGV